MKQVGFFFSSAIGVGTAVDVISGGVFAAAAAAVVVVVVAVICCQ